MKKDFDLNPLPIAVALYEERSVTLAARKLGMSQPALSEVLGKLRKVLDAMNSLSKRVMEWFPRRERTL